MLRHRPALVSLLAWAFLVSFVPACSTTDGVSSLLPGALGNFGRGPTSTDQNAPPGAPAAENDGDSVNRAIEEADLVKVVEDYVYVLNRYRGLLIIDATDVDHPVVAGDLNLFGRGVEMYVDDGKAYVLLSADYYYGYAGGGVPVGALANDAILPPQPGFEGSQLAVIDVSDKTDPKLDGKINLVGYANESRRVGDVIYVIGTTIPVYTYASPGAEGDDQTVSSDAASEPYSPVDEGFVASINIADPDNVEAVERETFAGSSLTMHTSQSKLYAASQRYDVNDGDTYTNVQVVDISDPAGQIETRGSFEAPGYLRNRFYMDEYDDVLRMVTQSWGFGFREVTLFTFDVSNPDEPAALGEQPIIQNESLEAVRFDGPRGYAVTFLRVDPLFVLDLSDPADPEVAGFLEVPGFSTHIEPRGDRLIAVGIDDTDGNRPAVAYYDVSDPANPSQLGRVILGPPGSYTDSQATYDEKAFKVVDELGLIAVPFHHVDYGDVVPPPGGIFPLLRTGAAEYAPPDCTDAVQLVDFDDDGLEQRGFVEHEGRVERVGVIGGRLFSLSQQSFQTTDISDRDNPTLMGQAELIDEDDQYYYDECNGYYPFPTPLPGPFPDDIMDAIPVLIEIFIDGDLCGVISATPLAGLVAGLWLLQRRAAWRRRRR